MRALLSSIVVLVLSLICTYIIITVHRIKFSPQSTSISPNNIDDIIQIADIETYQGMVRFSADGDFIIIMDSSGIRVIGTKTGKDYSYFNHTNCRFNTVCHEFITDIAIRNDSRWLITASSIWQPNGKRGSIKLWNLREKRLIGSLISDIGIKSIELSSDNSLLAYQIDNTNMDFQLIDMNTRQAVTDFSITNVDAFSFSPTSPILAYSSDGIHLWDYHNSQTTTILQNETFNHIVFSPNGEWIAGWNDATIALLNNISLINIRTGTRHLLKIQADGLISDVTFSPDSNLIASSDSSMPNYVRVWDVESGEIRYQLESSGNGANILSFNFDGTLLSAADIDSVIRIWNVEDGSIARNLQFDEMPIQGIFSPSGELFISHTIHHIQIWGITP